MRCRPGIPTIPSSVYGSRLCGAAHRTMLRIAGGALHRVRDTRGTRNSEAACAVVGLCFADPRCELGLSWARTAKTSAEPQQRPLHEDVEQQAQRHDNTDCDKNQ